MTAIAVIIALPHERRPLENGLRSAVSTAQIRIRLSGLGAERAAHAARAAVAEGACALVSFGCAGGLDPVIRSGTVVLPKVVRDRFGTPITTDVAWRRRFADAIATAVPIAEGEGLEVAVVAETPQDKERLYRWSTCAFADMESASIGAIAREYQLPFLVIRAVADTALDTMPHRVLGTLSPDGSGHLGRVIAALVKAPGEIGAVITLARRFRRACSSLETVARYLPVVTVGDAGEHP